MFATVFLNRHIAPGGQDWHRGKVVNQSSFGVTVESSTGQRVTYPSHMIEKLSENQGW